MPRLQLGSRVFSNQVGNSHLFDPYQRFANHQHIIYRAKSLYRRSASVRNTRTIAPSQASIFHSDADTLPPNERARTVSIIGVTGLICAKTCNQVGIVSIGT